VLIDFFKRFCCVSVDVISAIAMFLTLGGLAPGIAVLNFVNLATAQRRAARRSGAQAIGATSSHRAPAPRRNVLAVAIAFAFAVAGGAAARLLERREIVIGLPGEPGAANPRRARGLSLAAAAYPHFAARVHARALRRIARAGRGGRAARCSRCNSRRRASS
jgi:hypothetical protein